MYKLPVVVDFPRKVSIVLLGGLKHDLDSGEYWETAELGSVCTFDPFVRLCFAR